MSALRVTPIADPATTAAGPAWLVALETEARRRLPDYVYRYFAMTAGDGRTHAAGLREWSEMVIRPRVLAGEFFPDTATTVLGCPVNTPVLVAPMAQLVAAAPNGEAAAGVAAAGAGSLIGVSTNTAVPFPLIQAAGAPWWYQVYVMRDRALTEAVVLRARDAGARALVVTVDLPSLGDRNPQFEPANWPDPELARRGTNLDDLVSAMPDGRVTAAVGPDAVGWLRKLTGLPVVVKGVLRDDDARRCVDAGAAGVIVSTHGGRAMDRSITSAAALPAVVRALDGTGAEVYADSGLRSGVDVLAALALGARAVFIGRPVLWGLTVGGESGAQQVIERLTGELRTAMQLSGVTTLRDIGRDILA